MHQIKKPASVTWRARVFMAVCCLLRISLLPVQDIARRGN
jgi:hypothetical protein